MDARSRSSLFGRGLRRRGCQRSSWFWFWFQKHDALLLGKPEGRVKRLQKLSLVLVDERHVVFHVVESQHAAGIIHVDPDPRGFGAAERRLHIAVPRGEAASVPLHTPGEVVSRDAAVALGPLAVDALVGQADVSAFSSHIHLEIVAAQVEAVHRQHLLEVLEALGELWIALLPRRRVCHLL